MIINENTEGWSNSNLRLSSTSFDNSKLDKSSVFTTNNLNYELQGN
ncbi:hypothetical protein J4447_04220 [Candidatus Pacearchaeota archaeon]|nr:hypothetical protein [Candidatus Pacearchaeota archaeon]